MYNTVSLEIAKELFELGWKRAGIFVYDNEQKIEHLQQGFSYFKGEYALKELRDIKRMHNDVIPAPQIHEILEVLPFKISIGIKTGFLKMSILKVGDDYYIGYYKCDGGYTFEETIEEKGSKNPHDAAAKLLIWCVKNNYITL